MRVCTHTHTQTHTHCICSMPITILSFRILYYCLLYCIINCIGLSGHCIQVILLECCLDPSFCFLCFSLRTLDWTLMTQCKVSPVHRHPGEEKGNQEMEREGGGVRISPSKPKCDGLGPFRLNWSQSVAPESLAQFSSQTQWGLCRERRSDCIAPGIW
jgi:hypothetical protein